MKKKIDMRNNLTRTLSFIAISLWLVALLMVIGAFLAVRADTGAARPRYSARQASQTIENTPAFEPAAEDFNNPVNPDNALIAPQGVPFPAGSLEHTFYPLDGVHAVLECESCHADLIYAGTSLDCLSCHEDSTPRDHYEGDCALCHTPSAWQDVIFNHTAVNATNCATCHSETAPSNHYAGQCSNCHNTSSWTSVTFNHNGFTNCTSCHSDKAPANHFAGQCSSCHNTSTWKGATFNHSGQTNCEACHSPPKNHFAGACSNCHKTKNWSFNHSGQANCLSCHKNDEPDDEDHPHGRQCSECHNTNDWDDAEKGDSVSIVTLTIAGDSPHSQTATDNSGTLEPLNECATCHEKP